MDDDYIKFIRFAEHFIEKNGSGIVAMITNNSFIDGVTHRQMRKHLLETFDDIYILDLHGSTKKKEHAPNGSKDENVFNIEQGVSINILIRKYGKQVGLGTVRHAEIYGTQEFKFKKLNESTIKNVIWEKLNYSHPNYFFVPKDFGANEEYEKGFVVDEIFPISNSGVKTDRDALFIDRNKDSLEFRMQKLLSGDYDENFKQTFRVIDSSSYKLTERLKRKSFNEGYIKQIQYRPFDYRWIYYDPSLVSRPGRKVFKHLVSKDNLALLTCRQQSTFSFQHAFITKDIVDICAVSLQTKETGYAFPLYLYYEDGTRTSNLKKEIVDEIEVTVGKVSPEDIFDYIYAVLHSPKYRQKYKEFLKIDFPRLPYPKDKNSFRKLVSLGSELRALHLLESPKVNKLITTYPIAGSDTVEKIEYKEGNVFINSSQYFGNISEVAWNFYIGGYQPAQKWLKDRKGRTLNNSDIEHYQKIIVALTETDKLMKEIDKIVTKEYLR